MKMLVLFASILLASSVFVNGSKNDTVELFDEDFFLRNKYIAMDKGLKRIVQKSLKSLTSTFIKERDRVNISMTCIGNLLQITQGLRGLEPWALNFLDASGKVNDGLLNGNSLMLGNYDQCLLSTVEKKNGDIDFTGRYCLIHFQPFLPDKSKTPTFESQVEKINSLTQNVSNLIKIYMLKSELMADVPDFFGVCVPSGCSEAEVANFAELVSEMTYLNLTLEYCELETETRKFDRRNVAIICVLALFGLLGIIGSALEYYSMSKNVKLSSMAAKVLICFSITTNFPKLISTKTTDKALSCLYGIRVLTMFYIILGHSYATKYMVFMQTNAFPNITSYLQTFFFQIVVNGFLSVEVFFFLGGFVNSYIQIKRKETTKSSSWWMMIIHRLWRIYPVYIFSLLLVMILTPRGPLRFRVENLYTEKCYTNWWKLLFFINNLFDNNGQDCMPHTWYIACDMQLFLLSLLTVPLLIKNPKKGVIVNIIVIVCGLIFTALWVYMKKVPPTYLYGKITKEILLRVTFPLVTPLSHVAPYFSGVILGYFMSTKTDIRIPKICQIIGWIIASISFTSMIFITMKWNSGASDYTVVESVLYFTFSKPLYAISVGWMVFCCVTGHGGIVNYILSLKIWIPLGRLAFGMYLLSFPIQLFFMANLRRPIDSQWMVEIWKYFGDLCVSCLLSLVAVILAESPILALEKLFFSKGDIEKKKNGSSVNTTINTHSVEDNNVNNIALENHRNCYDNKTLTENIK